MGDPYQVNENLKIKAEKYKIWTTEESNELLKLMVDAAHRGWRDTNGSFSKITVEKKILPALNEKLGCQKTHFQYMSRLKWYKARYTNYTNLMRFNSGFGWDPIAKQFTAPNEVWDEYLKAHPTHKNYRTDTIGDYEDLRIAVGNGTAVGTHAIGLGEDTDARTHDEEESRVRSSLDDLVFDYSTGTFMQSDTQDLLSVTSEPIDLEVPPTAKKRSRNEVDDKYAPLETTINQVDVITQIGQSIEKLAEAVKSFDSAEYSCWDLIKELPELDKRTRYKALKLLNTRAKKIEFVKMTPEERFDWILYELEE